MFVIAAAAEVATFVARKHGPGPGVVAGILAAGVSIALVISFYYWMARMDKRQLQKLRDKYRTVYRVLALPTDPGSIVKPAGAEIKVGDYGWEDGPIRKDGLIHLQGLTLKWRVVWHAGFRPDQIEAVAPKPSSQYDYWVPYWAKVPPPPPCPFPVQERETPTMGLPHHSLRYLGTDPKTAR